MKKYLKIISIVTIVLLFISGCTKKNEVGLVTSNVGTTLTSTQSSVVITSANISSQVLNLHWTSPKLAAKSISDSSNIKYTIQIDTANGKFLNATRKLVYGIYDTSFTGQELNDILIAYGCPYGVAKNMIVRVGASYANNDDMLYSNTLTIPMTAYANPFNLAATSTGAFAPTVSNKDQTATTLSWNVPTTATTLTYVLQYDSTGKNFANVHELSLGTAVTSQALTNLNVNTYAQQCGIAYGTQGKIDVRIKAVGTTNAAQIQYSTLVTLTVTPQSMTLYMFMAGDYQGWSPSTAPKVASTDGASYEGYVWVPSGGTGEFKFATHTDWSNPNYGIGSSAGTLSTSGGNLVWPATGAYYLVKANTSTLTYGITAITTWGVIGDATPGGWSTSTPLTYNATTNKWSATVTFGSGSFKFRANDGWDINLGSTGGDGTSIMPLKYGGGNLPAPSAGAHVVTLDLSNPLNYTYSVQ